MSMNLEDSLAWAIDQFQKGNSHLRHVKPENAEDFQTRHATMAQAYFMSGQLALSLAYAERNVREEAAEPWG